MRHTVTYDHGDRTELERIYDRLRKASWRQTLRHLWDYDIFIGHKYYIRGLKDALNAVRESRGQQ